MRHETKQLLRNIFIGLGTFALIGLVLYGVWHGTRLPQLTIDQVVVSGGETISHTAIADDVAVLLEGEYLQFVPRTFAWTYPQAEIILKLNEVERLKDPQLQRDGTTLNVTLSEYKPAALWCADATEPDCVFVDETGYGFTAAPPLSGGAFVRYVQIGQPVVADEHFTTADDFVLLQDLVDRLGQADLPVRQVELDQARDVFVYLAGGGELKVSLLISPADTLDNLQTVLATEQYRHLEPGKFVYIDLRFGNKVFVSEFGTPIEEEAEVEEGADITADTVLEQEVEVEAAASVEAAGG